MIKLGPITLRENMLTIEPNASLADIVTGASALFFFQRNAPWWIGDLINFGEARWGDDIWQAVPDGTSESMVGRYAAHAKKMKPSDRVDGASWTMHSMAAKLDPKLRKKLLQRAVSESMSTDKFNALLRNARNA